MCRDLCSGVLLVDLLVTTLQAYRGGGGEQFNHSEEVKSNSLLRGADAIQPAVGEDPPTHTPSRTAPLRRELPCSPRPVAPLCRRRLQRCHTKQPALA
jgi:hypothetical protein